MTECAVEFGVVEVRPEAVAEIQLRVGQVPEQEIADALFATGADEEVRIGRLAERELRANAASSRPWA